MTKMRLNILIFCPLRVVTIVLQKRLFIAYSVNSLRGADSNFLTHRELVVQKMQIAKKLIDEDPRRSIRELTDLTGLSYGNVHRVINENYAQSGFLICFLLTE